MEVESRNKLILFYTNNSCWYSQWNKIKYRNSESKCLDANLDAQEMLTTLFFCNQT